MHLDNGISNLLQHSLPQDSNSHLDYSLFTKRTSGQLVVVLVYVDNLIITRDLQLIHETKSQLQDSFKIKDFGELKYFLRIEFARSKEGCKPVTSPLELNAKLTTLEFETHICSTTSDLYSRILVQTLSQFMHSPKSSHMEAALRVVRCVKHCPGLGMLMKAGCSGSLASFWDVDWAACPNSRRSITGYLVKFGDSLISWESKKQSTVSQKFTEVLLR
uniref:Uncharacterized mitochondrial protein AtMg00810-like n=1 Tax=Nicotiana tabacum TaxID=4097 RepID=A0A1S4BZF2_TOBAC|nr:PREDICTED: uncharacterized mitochondrial protein AtMg00810-like [Nicotiana tabacum]